MWMLSPEPSECPRAEDYAPSCPGSTRGCYWRGRTRVSLIDPVDRRVVNTVAVTDPFSGSDAFDVPRKLYGHTPYHVGRDHEPTLLRLHDYNHDGTKNEFVLFDAESCSDMFTGLFGYSSRRDRVIQYRARISSPDWSGEAHWPETLFWISPKRDGVWRYGLSWPGTEPPLSCEARYRPEEELFEVRCLVRK